MTFRLRDILARVRCGLVPGCQAEDSPSFTTGIRAAYDDKSRERIENPMTRYVEPGIPQPLAGVAIVVLPVVVSVLVLPDHGLTEQSEVEEFAVTQAKVMVLSKHTRSLYKTGVVEWGECAAVQFEKDEEVAAP